jgi:hypothetical protein
VVQPHTAAITKPTTSVYLLLKMIPTKIGKMAQAIPMIGK